MYQKTRIIFDWIVVLTIYCLVLLIIPISDKLFGHLNVNSVDVVLNLIINVLISAVFISLLVYLIKGGSKTQTSSYVWLLIFLIIITYFLMKVEIVGDRLHLMGYGILSLFLYRALRHNIGTEMLYIWSAISIMLFAILDEALQIFNLGGRSFEFKDIGIDWLGGLVGQTIIAMVIRPKLETVDIKIRRYIKGLRKIQAFEVKHRPGLQRLDLDRLAGQICLAFKNATGQDGGHVHFIYKGKNDHLILICNGQRLDEIIAKRRHSKKGEYLSWYKSEFYRFSPRNAFLEFLPEIHRIIIDHPSIQKRWSSFDKFQGWLDQTAIG